MKVELQSLKFLVVPLFSWPTQDPYLEGFRAASAC
jgi:hypothetical protein